MNNGWILHFKMRWILGGYYKHLEVDIGWIMWWIMWWIMGGYCHFPEIRGWILGG